MQIDNYDLLVVGSGISGATVAYIAAHDYHQKVLVLEKENHVAGAIYDERDEETGLLVQRYGSHFVHTNNEYVYKLLSSITDWNPFQLEAKTVINGKEISIPFHYGTIDSLYPAKKAVALKRRLAKEFRFEKHVPMMTLLRSEDEEIAAFAKLLMSQHFIPLTAQQRGVSPDMLSGIVMNGHFFQLGYADGCYLDRYQMLPEEGFAALIEKMLDSPYITVQLNTDVNKHLSVREDKDSEKNILYWDEEKITCPVVYTASLDGLFDYRYGTLPYRNLKITFETSSRRLSAPCVNYPMGKQGYSSTDFAYFNQDQVSVGKTVLSRESIAPDGFPAFSANDVNGRKANRRYSLYRRQADRVENLYLCGRLAEYRFITIADAIAEAMNLFGVLPFSDIDLTPDYVSRRPPMEEIMGDLDCFKKNSHVESQLIIGDLRREIPKITVVIPTYNRLDSLKETLESVWNQDIPEDQYEVLIVDNDPTPNNDTQKYLESLSMDNLFYYRNAKNLGAYGNQNRCFELVRSNWASTVHDDDILFPNALRWALESIDTINDPKTALIIPRQLPVYSKQEMNVRRKEKGFIHKRIEVRTHPAQKLRWKIYEYYKHHTRRRFWKISAFDCYMIPFLYPAPTYGTVTNVKAFLDSGGFAEGYPISDNFLFVKMSQTKKYHIYLCGETWGLYSFYTADVTKPRSALQFVDAMVQYRLYMEKQSLLCRLVGKLMRQGAYLDAVEGDFWYGKSQRGYNAARECYQYYSEYHATEKQRIRARRMQKIWELWINVRTVLFGKRISFDMVKRCHGEHV